MSKIKICGLSRIEDIEYVNILKPDYVGFIIDFPDSHRSIDFDTVKMLIEKLDKNIKSVCVFVNKDPKYIEKFKNICNIVQLHGGENNDYINKLKDIMPGVTIWKAFKIKNKDDIVDAKNSTSDMVLLDNGYGTGEQFDWTIICDFNKDFILAGGIDYKNVKEAIKNLKPYALDASSSVEKNKVKDFNKIKYLIETIRGEI